MRSLSEEGERNKFVMKHHKHGGGERRKRENRGKEQANQKQSRQRTDKVHSELRRDWIKRKRI